MNNCNLTFNYIFPDYNTFVKKMKGTIIDGKTEEIFFNFLYRRFSNRAFKWSNEFQIISRVETTYYETSFKFNLNKEIYDKKLDEIATINVINKSFLPNTKKDTNEIEERFLSGLNEGTSRDKNYIKIKTELQNMDGIYEDVINSFSKLFIAPLTLFNCVLFVLI